MAKIVVTGGAGFIGSHLCERLIEEGHFVLCIDNLLTGDKKNIKALLNNKRFKFELHDITQSPLPIKVADYVFHLASPASPVDYMNFPLETLSVNSIGTANVLEAAKKLGARILIASTSEVYGDPLEHPQKETYWGNVNSFGPRACYDEAKRFSESLAYVYLHKYNVDVRIVRIFNTYGPRMQKDDGRVVSNFINQALNGLPLTIYGKGDQTRSFCFVSDLISGIHKFMFTPKLKGEVINIGNPNEFTILELAEMIKHLINSTSEIIFHPLPKDDPKKRKPNISKAKKLLNWQPKIKIDQGIKETIKYYK